MIQSGGKILKNKKRPIVQNNGIRLNISTFYERKRVPYSKESNLSNSNIPQSTTHTIMEIFAFFAKLFSIIMVVDDGIYENDGTIWGHAGMTCWPVLTCQYWKYWQVPFDTFYVSRGFPATHPLFQLAVFRDQNKSYLEFHLGTQIYIVCLLHTYFPAKIYTGNALTIAFLSIVWQ